MSDDESAVTSRKAAFAFSLSTYGTPSLHVSPIHILGKDAVSTGDFSPCQPNLPLHLAFHFPVQSTKPLRFQTPPQTQYKPAKNWKEHPLQTPQQAVSEIRK